MGNHRSVFENLFPVKMLIQEEKKQVSFLSFNDFPCEKSYRELRIDQYGCPDVIMNYRNNRDNSDVWRRIEIVRFYDAALIRSEMPSGDDTQVVYSYKNIKREWIADYHLENNNVPFGKTAGMTSEQVREYDAENKYSFRYFDLPPVIEKEWNYRIVDGDTIKERTRCLLHVVHDCEMDWAICNLNTAYLFAVGCQPDHPLNFKELKYSHDGVEQYVGSMMGGLKLYVQQGEYRKRDLTESVIYLGRGAHNIGKHLIRISVKNIPWIAEGAS